MSQDYDRIAFYNVENFFDTRYDSTKYFNGFTPKGDHHWSKTRYYQKREHIYKVIAAVGGWNGVTVMGFAEIENRGILEDLITNTPLKKSDYGIVHFESPDKRGIDVGMIYRKKRFKVIKANPIRVKNPDNPSFTTRDILYVKGILLKDTIHIFYNHWPSRYGGMMNTVTLRALAASTLQLVVDSILEKEPLAKVVILGDFNDNPDDKSIQLLLHNGKHTLEALSPSFDYGNTTGTIKHNTDWAIFDQVIVSPDMFSTKGLHLKNHNMHIFDAGFLLINDEKNLGKKLNRTFVGFNYNGGFSDHLPVYVDVYKQ
ncbi:MAG: endonuclease [Bacteroidetes bacterium]|nr:MAG: endonuclease [Bacteroidota bacterium]